MRSRTWLGALGLAVALAWSSPAAAEWTAPLPTDKVDGGVNWTTGYITATAIGVAPPNAVSAAQGRALAITAGTVLARQGLLEIARGVAIDARTTVANLITTSTVTEARVSGVIRGAQVVRVRDLGDGSVEVTVAVPATGEFADLVVPQAMRPSSTPTPSTPAPRPQTAPPPSGIVYTGLVIDARGLGIKPAMAPKVMSEGGQEVYGFSVVDRNWVIQQGMAGYSKDLGSAQAHERVTDRPLTLKAVAAAGSNKTDVVISNVDAGMLLASGQNLAFLEKARVMLVVD
jgi:hypothetical protein